MSAQSFKGKNAKKASLYSAIIPGAGQIYTEKYWKIPIIYSGLIASAYYIKQNNDQYKLYRSTYLNRINNDNNTDQFQGEYSNQDLVILTDFYRRNREVSTLLFTLTYLLNIIDASVSAHLFSFDVSEDLSMNIKPIYFMHSKSSGIQLSFNL